MLKRKFSASFCTLKIKNVFLKTLLDREPFSLACDLLNVNIIVMTIVLILKELYSVRFSLLIMIQINRVSLHNN